MPFVVTVTKLASSGIYGTSGEPEHEVYRQRLDSLHVSGLIVYLNSSNFDESIERSVSRATAEVKSRLSDLEAAKKKPAGKRSARNATAKKR